jgi:hypothetical protein
MIIGGRNTKLITDESNADLAYLLGSIRTLAPEFWGSGQRSLILPKELGDLEKPEYLEQINEKVKEIKLLHDMLDSGQITPAQYLSRKAIIFSGM